MLQDDSLLNHDIEQRINLIYQNLCNVHNFVAPPYGHQIDVHICFSLCGGTGSGIYLDIIQKFRRIIPNANVICYAFSHIFYDHIGVHYLVESNEYASLLEADLSKAGYPEFAELAAIRKALKDDLKYSEDFSRTGYIGHICGVPVIVSKAVNKNEVYLATKEAVTVFIKKGTEIETHRDKNKRQNFIIARKYMVVALTDDTRVIRLVRP